MAKETTIFFIYDTLRVQKEQDDPVTAILYFSPNWVSDSQKTSLCGQIMGTAQCLTKLIGCPKIISLQSGKFCLRAHGRYFMVVGSDRNIDDWILEYRSNILNSLLQFYHKDFKEIAKVYDKYESLSAKIYYIFETYLKILTTSGNVFFSIPTMTLPRSAGSCFLEAVNILRCCQDIDHVLGGIVLYHNKVVATQFSPSITKNIVITDPYRIKSPAEVVEIDFSLPLGVQLLQVYIPNYEFNKLSNNTSKLKRALKGLQNGKCVKSFIKEPSLKKDTSLLFTTVPEEDDEKLDTTNTDKKSLHRPKFLNLKNVLSNDLTMDDKDPSICFTPVTNNPGSLVFTPMKDINRILHVNPISICANKEVKKEVELKKISQFLNLKRWSSLTNLNNINEPYKLLRDKSKSVDEIQSIKQRTECHTDFKKYYNISIKNYTPSFTKDCLKFQNVKLDNLCQNNKPKNTTLDNVDKISKRKSLTLPLKSLSFDSGNESSTPVPSTLSGLLTPLMQKLSTPAFDDRSEFSSYLSTPIDAMKSFLRKNASNSTKIEALNLENDGFTKCILFLCGQQDTAIGLLLNNDASTSKEVINALWEISTSTLGPLEKQFQHSLELAASGDVTTRRENYSFLCLDEEWDTVKRGGPWGNIEQSMMNRIHRDFRENPDFTDFAWRNNDGIMYSFHMGNLETFFYKQADAPAGLPPPSDVMGNIPNKTRQILEKDHNIVLL